MGGFVINFRNQLCENDISIFLDRKQKESFNYSNKYVQIVKFRKVLLDSDEFIFERITAEKPQNSAYSDSAYFCSSFS